MPIITVPAFRAPFIEERIQKLAKKANKYGNDPITISLSEPYIAEHKNHETGEMTRVSCVDINVEGGAPIIEGYSLLGRVEMLGDNACLVHESPTADMPIDQRFRHHDGSCDHCKINRYRKDVYVFSDGENQIAVGRSCLRDYMGIDNPAKIVQSMSFWESLSNEGYDDEINSFFGSSNTFRLKEVMAQGAASIRNRGWVSKSKMQETGDFSTADAVSSALRGYPEWMEVVEEEDRLAAQEAIDYFRSGEFEGNYLLNVQTLLQQDIVNTKNFGLVVSALAVVAREKAKEENQKAQSTSEYLGEIKERMRNVEVEVTSIKNLGHGMYGPTYLVNMSSNGNTIVWFTGNPTVDEGDKVTVDATVKDHKDYNGVKQTVVTRVKVK